MTVTDRKSRLADIQFEINAVIGKSRPSIAGRLSGQFAKMLSDDVWEECDELPSMDAVRVVLRMVIVMDIRSHPGIGTNGRGNLTLFWRRLGLRATLECGPSGYCSLICSAIK